MKDIFCNIITIGENKKHYPWRICSYCGGNIEDMPERCPYCNAIVIGLEDRYVRRKRIVLD